MLPLRIVLVDDHPIVRAGFRQLLNLEEGWDVVADVGSAAELAAWMLTGRCDVLVLDLSLPDGDGLVMTRQLLAQRPELAIVILSMHDGTLYVQEALAAGARGYVMKESAPDRLVESVLSVFRGEIVVSPQVQTKMLSAMAGQRAERATGEASLSPREAEVLRLIGEGLTTQQIAARMHRSVKTVEAHRSNLQRKLELGCALQLVRYATLWVAREGRA